MRRARRHYGWSAFPRDGIIFFRALALIIVLVMPHDWSPVPSAAGANAVATTASQVIGWGQYSYGQLGDDFLDTGYDGHPYAAQVTEQRNIVAAGGSRIFSAFLDTDGHVSAMGLNAQGTLGINNDGINGSYTPLKVVSPSGTGQLSGVVSIAVGESYTLALLADGKVVGWGFNNWNQLGNGKFVQQSVPVYVRNPNGSGDLTGLTAIAAGCEHSLALTRDGTVFAWGHNANGQLGNGLVEKYSPLYPVQVLSPDGTTPLSNIKAIAAGCSHSLALTNDGTIYTWGSGFIGQLGNGAFDSHTLPVRVIAPNGGLESNLRDVGPIATISAGYGHNVALLADGTVYRWGWDDGGGGYDPASNKPRLVPKPDGTGALSGVTAAVAAYKHTLALAADGTVYTWGDNTLSGLGDGTTGGRSDLPVRALRLDGTPLTGVVGIGGGPGSRHSLAIAPVSVVHAVVADPSGLNFGAQNPGTRSAPRSVTFTNSGITQRSIGPVTVTGEFVKLGDTCTGTLSVGAHCTVTVTFAPMAVGDQYGGISLVADGITQPFVGLRGIGQEGPFTVTATVEGAGTIAPSGVVSYATGARATYAASPAPGQLFLGWTLDGSYVGYGNTIDFIVNGERTLTARFAPSPTFGDVPLNDPDYQAISLLAAQGIINPAGINSSGLFQPDTGVKRAEMAAFVARVFGWQREQHQPAFPDQCAPDSTSCIDAELWNTVAALADYGVVGGYTDGATCASAATTAPCYLPRDPVSRLQVVSIVARAFTKTSGRASGFWERLPGQSGQYTNIADAGTQRSDLATYRQNAGAIPGQADDGTFPDPSGAATRRFVIEVLWRAYDAQFGTNRVP